MTWVQSGEYDRIVSGEYVRRGQEPDWRAETDAATGHYTGRQGAPGRGGAGRSGSARRGGPSAKAGDAAAKLQEWLRRVPS